MRKQNKVLVTALVVGLAAVVGGFGVFAAFSDTTSNPSNTFAAGTVVIDDNDGGTALFSNAVKQKPGDYDRCINVTYTGSLDATVKLYSSAITGTGSDLNVTVHKGAGVEADCSDFVADGSAVFTNTLANLSSSHSNFSNGLTVNPGSATKWVESDELAFRFRITVPDANSAQNKSVNAFDLTWEAQNQ